MIYSKIASVKSEIGTLTKKSNNPFYKSKYLELSDLLEAVEPLLEKNGLVLLQPCRDGKVWSEIYDIETGEVVQSYIELTPDKNPQQMGSQISYFRRYSLAGLLAIQQQDDDANSTVPKPPVKKKPALSQERFQAGLDKVNADEITRDQFIELCDKYTLTDTQKKSINLFKQLA